MEPELFPDDDRGASGRRADVRPRVLRAADFPGGAPTGPAICGIDEAGRGPLAGPVAAGAAILPADFPIGLLDDSKALSEPRREKAYAAIIEGALAWAVAWASPAEIDELNILGASLLAMRRAYLALGAVGQAAEWVYVDGNRFPDLGRPCWPVIKGDAIVPAVMAGSILAKVSRDREMLRYDELYPDYGYAKHKGYPTAEHREACRRLGPSPIQRMSFKY